MLRHPERSEGSRAVLRASSRPCDVILNLSEAASVRDVFFCHPERVCESRDPGSFYAKTLAMLVGKIGVLRLAQRSLRMTEEEALTFRHSPDKFTNSHDDRRERGRSAALEEVVLPRRILVRHRLRIEPAHRLDRVEVSDRIGGRYPARHGRRSRGEH